VNFRLRPSALDVDPAEFWAYLQTQGFGFRRPVRVKLQSFLGVTWNVA
jgi:hypothetical protein